MTDSDRTLTKSVRLSAEATLPHMAALRGEILTALDATDVLVLDASAVEEVDFAFFQTLCAAHREAHGRGKRLELAGWGDHISAVAAAAGFTREKGAPPGRLWTESHHE